MPEQSLKQKTTVGILWSLLERSSVQIIQFVLGIILARILLPSDFGLIGVLTIFIVISRLFIDSGFANALIQKKDRTEEDFSTVFYFNIVISVACYLLLYLIAPFISDFYHNPELTFITRILFLSLIINSFVFIPNTKLTIALDFRKKAIINFMAVVISGGISIWMAYNDYGVWALIAQTLSSCVITLLLLLLFVHWKPLLVFSQSSFRILFNFGSKLLGAAIIDAIVDNLYTILIGRHFSLTQAGYYTRGLQIPTVITATIGSALENVTYPVMASVQDNRELLITIYRRLIRTAGFFLIPAMICLAFISEPFIRYFLTEKWMPAVILMQWVCVARIFTPIILLSLNLFNAIGRSDLFLKINLGKLPLIILILIITISMGLKAIVIGLLIYAVIGFVINTYIAGRLFNGYGTMAHIKDLLPFFGCACLMLVVLFILSCFVQQDLLKVISCIIVGGSVYYFSAFLFKIQEVQEFNGIIHKLLGKKFNNIITND